MHTGRGTTDGASLPYYLGSHKMKGTAHALFTVATHHRMCYEIIGERTHNSSNHTHNSGDHVHNRGNHVRKNGSSSKTQAKHPES